MGEAVEHTVIGRVIILSKVIIEIKDYKRGLDILKNQANRIHINVSDEQEFLKLLNTVQRRRSEVHNAIKTFLYPLFQGHDFDYMNEYNWAFTKKEMLRGYLDLNEILDRDSNGNPIRLGSRFIMPLSDYKDKTHDIFEGTLLPFNKVAPILGNLYKNMFDNTPIRSKLIVKR